jgi:hypothetical protein
MRVFLLSTFSVVVSLSCGEVYASDPFDFSHWETNRPGKLLSDFDSSGVAHVRPVAPTQVPPARAPEKTWETLTKDERIEILSLYLLQGQQMSLPQRQVYDNIVTTFQAAGNLSAAQIKNYKDKHSEEIEKGLEQRKDFTFIEIDQKIAEFFSRASQQNSDDPMTWWEQLSRKVEDKINKITLMQVIETPLDQIIDTFGVQDRYFRDFILSNGHNMRSARKELEALSPEQLHEKLINFRKELKAKNKTGVIQDIDVYIDTYLCNKKQSAQRSTGKKRTCERENLPTKRKRVNFRMNNI